MKLEREMDVADVVTAYKLVRKMIKNLGTTYGQRTTYDVVHNLSFTTTVSDARSSNKSI